MMASKSVGVIPLALSLVTSFMSGQLIISLSHWLKVKRSDWSKYYFSDYCSWCSRRDFEMRSNVWLVFNHILFCLRLDCVFICSGLLQNGTQGPDFSKFSVFSKFRRSMALPGLQNCHGQPVEVPLYRRTFPEPLLSARVRRPCHDSVLEQNNPHGEIHTGFTSVLLTVSRVGKVTYEMVQQIFMVPKRNKWAKR